DLFPPILTDIANPNIARCRINAESPRMAESDGIKFAAERGLIDRHAVEVGDSEKRIVWRDAVKCVAAAVGRDSRVRSRFDAARLFIDVEAQDARKQIEIEALRVHVNVVLAAFVPGGNVEVTVEAEMEIAAVVIEFAIDHSVENLLSVGIDGQVDRIG